MMVSMAKAVLLEILNKTNFIYKSENIKDVNADFTEANDFVSLLINQKNNFGKQKSRQLVECIIRFWIYYNIRILYF